MIEIGGTLNFGKVFKGIDALMTVLDLTKDKTPAAPDAPASAPGGQIETRLTNLVVAALKEAFDRDHARLELERAHIEEQRRRADEAMQLELRKQAADRELGRLRLLAAASLVGWIVSVILLVMRTGDVSVASSVVLAAGCLMLLGSLGAAFTAQGRIDLTEPISPSQTGPAMAALWLLLAGLALSAASLLL
jgi:hypothetical protein